MVRVFCDCWSYFESSPLLQNILIFYPSFADIPDEFMKECRGMIADDGCRFGIKKLGRKYNNQPVTKNGTVTNWNPVSTMSLDCKVCREAFVCVYKTKA